MRDLPMLPAEPGSYNLSQALGADFARLQDLIAENEVLRQEIRVAREAAEITARLVVKQFQETERVLRRFQNANAQRKAVLNAVRTIAIIATDSAGKIIVFNSGAENLLGYKSAEVVGKMTPLSFHDPQELADTARLLFGDSAAEKRDVEIFFEMARVWPSRQREWTYIKHNGQPFPVELSIDALREPGEAMTGVLCIAMDVSEKRRQEQALLQSERKYRLLINNLPNVVFKGYADGSIDFYDDKVEQLTGYSREDFLNGKISWFDIVSPEDMEPARNEFKRALKKRRPYIREYRVRSRDGSTVWIQEGGQILLDENGRIDFVTGAFLDITQRKEAEKALAESEATYRSLFDSNPNPIFVLNRDSLTIQDANLSAVEAYGFAKEELIGKRFSDLGDLKAEDERLEMIKLPACFEGFKTQKVRQYKKSGKPFFVTFRTCPAHYHGQDSVILALHDITEMMEKDALLIQASKMTTLGEMSAGIAHELNQPLNAIKAGSEFLLVMAEQGLSPTAEDLQEVASQVAGQVDRAAKIIRRLRAFGSKTDFKKERVDVNTPVQNVLSMIGKQLSIENIEILLGLAEDPPPVLAHENRLEQILFNLITNARDAILQKDRECGEAKEKIISIRTFAEGGHAGFAVSDTGAGMSEHVKDKIFEPFFTTKEVGKGMGLGLSIIYGIIRDYNGDIDVISQPGLGTTFTVTFPTVED